MKKFTPFLYFVLFALIFSSPFVYGQETKPLEKPRERVSLVTTEGVVTAIDKETRAITLKGPDGELVTVTAGEEIKRFNEIEVGDAIVFEYYTGIKAEFRAPTEAELADPIVVLAAGGKATDKADPAAAVGAMIKAVVTIEILNRPEMLATVKGPRGNYLTIEMEDEALMQRLNIGQQVILTYAEAMAISLTKKDPK